MTFGLHTHHPMLHLKPRLGQTNIQYLTLFIQNKQTMHTKKWTKIWINAALTSCAGLHFSVAKATLHSQMSVRSSIRLSVIKTPQQLEKIILHHSSFIIRHSSIIPHHFSSFFIHPFFISRLLSFSACFVNISPCWSQSINF